MYSDLITHFSVTCNPISSVWPSFKNGWVTVVLKWFGVSSSCHVLKGGSTGLACWQCRLSFCLAKGIWSLVVHLLQEKRSRLCDGHNDKELYGMSSSMLSKNVEQCTVTLATLTQRETQRHTLTHKHTRACTCKRNLSLRKLSMTMWTSAESWVLCWSLAFAVGCVCAGYSRRFNPNQYSPEWTPLCPISGVNPAVPHLRSAPPLWPVSSWQWLADLISAALNVASVAPLTTLLMSSFVALHLSTPTVAAAEIRRANSVCPVNCSRH